MELIKKYERLKVDQAVSNSVLAISVSSAYYIMVMTMTLECFLPSLQLRCNRSTKYVQLQIFAHELKVDVLTNSSAPIFNFQVQKVLMWIF